MASFAWERREDESAEAFEAFTHYRDFGANRSLAKVGQELGKSTTLMEKWSKKHQWVRRVALWEAEEDRLWLQGLHTERRKMAQRQARLAATMQGKLVDWLGATDFSKLTTNEASRLFEVACRIEQAVLGNPTNVNVTHSSGPYVEDLSPEETLDRLRSLYTELSEVVADEFSGTTTP